ncbi:hypothetical protein [Nonomuraea angiospora]
MASRRGAEPSRAALDRARRQGAAPELMYVVDLPGYEVAEQSVGVINDDGFGAVYTSSGGKRVELRIDRGPYVPTGTYERDGGGWYAVNDGDQEYVAVRKNHHIRLICPVGQVDRAVLKQAAQGARPAAGTGPPAPSPPAPVERGDLPGPRTGPGG